MSTKAIVLFLSIVIGGSIASQRANVKGKFKCGSRSATSGDTWYKMTNAKSKTDDMRPIAVVNDGTFGIMWTADTNLDNFKPKLVVHTHCNTDGRSVPAGCHRQIVYKVPVAAINMPKAYNFGTVDLATKTADEELVCTTKPPKTG